MRAGVRVVETAGELRRALAATAARAVPRSVGLVPTMGYLHEGHASLLRQARGDCDVVVASIFVNPTQFAPNEDYASYPRDLPRDLAMLADERVDVAFTPPRDGFYPTGADTFVVPGRVAEPLEGEHRPGHFQGVATVVTMLFNAVQPHRAYFGEKDWQQLQVVRRLVRDLLLPVDVVGLPVVREPDGLALSSRNVRLGPEARKRALCIPRALAAARGAFAAGVTDPPALERAMADVIAREPDVTADYAVVVDADSLQPLTRATAASRALIAARVEGVRLIDNTALGPLNHDSVTASPE
jgi:pantoate--beta-alanine ligase